MEKKEKEEISKNIDKFTQKFWTIDCLIRIMKEITDNHCFETREEDIYTICDLLVNESKSLSEELLLLKNGIKL